MAKKSSNFIDFSESSVWNVGLAYSQLKIMRPLFYLDEYYHIANFGSVDILEEFNLDESLKNDIRIKALTRLLKTLQLLINNAMFAVSKGDKVILKKYQDDLKLIEGILPLTHKLTINESSRSKELRINPKAFNFVLDMLIKIKEEVNQPLDRANLIYGSKEEFDPDEFKKRVMEDYANTG